MLAKPVKDDDEEKKDDAASDEADTDSVEDISKEMMKWANTAASASGENKNFAKVVHGIA